MDKIPDFVNKNTNTPKINTDAEAELSKLELQPDRISGVSGVYKLFGKTPPSGAGGGGMATPTPTNKKELDERIELLHFLIFAYTQFNPMQQNSPILTKFKGDCQQKFDASLQTKSYEDISSFIKDIDEQLLSNNDYVIIFTTLLNYANNNLDKDKFGGTLTKLLNSPKPMYEKYKALQTIYRIGKLMKGGKPRRTRRQKQQKSRRRQKQRKSRRRL